MLFIELAVTIALIGYILKLRKEIHTRDVRNSWVFGQAVIPMVVVSEHGEVRITTNLWNDNYGTDFNSSLFENPALAKLEPFFQDALKNGICVPPGPVELISVDGTAHWYTVNARRYDMNSPEVAIRLVDVTDAKTAGDFASERDNMINGILEHSQALVSFMNRDGTYALVNAKFASAVGRPASDIVGLTNYDLVPKEFADVYAANDENVMSSGQGITFEEVAEHTGVIHTYTSIKFPIRDRKSEVVGMGSIVYDVTKEKQAEHARAEAQVRERAALEASTTKSVFLANMSHELRTPINGIMGMAELLHSSHLGAEQADYAHSILQSADGLLTLVNDILDLTKAEAGKIEVESVPVSILRLVKDVEVTTRLSAQQKGLTLTFNADAGLSQPLMGDPTRLRQVIMNLVSNAIKFTPRGSVEVAVRAQGDSLHIEVSDTGIGISADALPKLFTSFTQADASTTRKFGGSGLGLSISRQLVELMGGEIGVEGKANGSMFWFKIPLRWAEIRPSTEALSAQTPLALAPVTRALRILIAEDNKTNQIIAAKMVQKLGHQTVVVENGVEALRELNVSDYDLVFMDCQMPEMDGYEATAAIRAGKSKASVRIPIVALTANAMQGDREKCIDAGMTDYVSKPMKAIDLESAIARSMAA